MKKGKQSKEVGNDDNRSDRPVDAAKEALDAALQRVETETSESDKLAVAQILCAELKEGWRPSRLGRGAREWREAVKTRTDQATGNRPQDPFSESGIFENSIQPWRLKKVPNPGEMIWDGEFLVYGLEPTVALRVPEYLGLLTVMLPVFQTTGITPGEVEVEFAQFPDSPAFALAKAAKLAGVEGLEGYRDILEHPIEYLQDMECPESLREVLELFYSGQSAKAVARIEELRAEIIGKGGWTSEDFHSATEKYGQDAISELEIQGIDLSKEIDDARRKLDSFYYGNREDWGELDPQLKKRYARYQSAPPSNLTTRELLRWIYGAIDLVEQSEQAFATMAKRRAQEESRRLAVEQAERSILAPILEIVGDIETARQVKDFAEAVEGIVGVSEGANILRGMIDTSFGYRGQYKIDEKIPGIIDSEGAQRFLKLEYPTQVKQWIEAAAAFLGSKASTSELSESQENKGSAPASKSALAALLAKFGGK